MQNFRSHVWNLKRDARALSKECNIKHSQALDIVAALHGHQNWQSLIRAECALIRCPFKFGVVLFDSVWKPSSAWVSLGGQKAYRIAEPHELATDTIWWTNLPYETFYERTNTWRSLTVKHDKYLTRSPNGVMEEWGLDSETVTGDFAVQLLAAAFSRVMQLAFRLLNRHSKGAGLMMFGGQTLRRDFQCLWPAIENPRGDMAVAINSTLWSNITVVQRDGLPKGSVSVLRMPRFAYALEMLKTPVPQGSFELHRDLQGMADAEFQAMLTQPKPSFVEVDINRIEEDLAPFFGFQSGTRPQKTWLPQNELLVLSKIADLNVCSAYVGQEYTTLWEKLPQDVKDFLLDEASENSWSAGIIAETIWLSAILSEKVKVSNDGPRALASLPGIWLLAADRMNMALAAIQCADRGYFVSAYGLGMINVRVPEGDKANLIRDGMTLGLLPGLRDVYDSGAKFASSIPWGGDPRAKITAELTVSNDRWLLWNMDRVVLGESKDERDRMEAQIVQNLFKRTKNGCSK
jgi:hypothetical protein